MVIPLLSRTGYDFRKTKWGMTKMQVKRAEKSKLLSEYDNSLRYYTKFAIPGNDSCNLSYTFIDDKLVKAEYVFMEPLDNDSDFRFSGYCYRFTLLKENLIKKYGKSINIVGYNKTIPKYWYLHKHIEYGITWENLDTNISLYIYRDGIAMDLFILYESLKLKSLIENLENIKKKKIMNDL